MSVMSRSDGAGREDVGAAGQVLLDDVVLRGAGQRAHRRPGPRRRLACSSAATWYSASSHIAVALIVIEVFIVASGMPSKSAPHVADVADRHADLADLAAGQDVVRVVAGLGGQVEGDGEAGLALVEVAAVERVDSPRRWSARHTCASPTDGRAPGAAGSCSPRRHGLDGSRAACRGGEAAQAVRGATPRTNAYRGEAAGARSQDALEAEPAAAGRCGRWRRRARAGARRGWPGGGGHEDAEPVASRSRPARGAVGGHPGRRR